MNRISSILLRAALPAALLTACTTTVTDDIEAGEESVSRAINFGTPALSRSAIENVNDENFTEFDVWGWYAPDGIDNYTQLFGKGDNGEVVSRKGGLWTYEGRRYWQEGRTYNFYALYPNGMDNANYNSDGTLTVSDFDCSGTGDDAVDLMAAARTDMSGNAPEKVAFTFRHLLTKVNIVATVENGNATVTSVSLSGVTMKGTLRGTTWSETSTGDFSNPSASIPLSVNETSLLGDMLLIPQSVGDFRLTVNYTLDGEEKTYQGNLSTASVTQWEAGNSYKYKLAIKGDNIIFTVNVSKWKTSTGGIITVE